jgi:hypothetical protein
VTVKPTGKKVEREARLRWVPLKDTRVNPVAQRQLNLARVDRIASEMELEQLGNPTVNLRGELFYIVDGQHRIEAYKKWCGDGNWEDQSFQCWAYEGLSEEEEAEVFLKLNDVLTVATFEKFRVGVRAGRVEETDIDRIVRAMNLRVSREKGNGAISAVGALRKVYALGPGTLARTLRIIRDAYGDAGLESQVLEGIGVWCSRYNGTLDEKWAIEKLGNAHGGVNGLLNMAEETRRKTGSPRAHSVAASAVEIYNRGRGGPKKLSSWWREEDQ